MLYPDFLRQLTATHRDWFLDEYGGIRRRNPLKGDQAECPICSLHPRYLHEALSAAADLELPRSLAIEIVAAADGYPYGSSPYIRADLLRATGIRP